VSDEHLEQGKKPNPNSRFFFHVAGSMPTLNTTMGKNMTITSHGGSVIIQLG